MSSAFAFKLPTSEISWEILRRYALMRNLYTLNRRWCTMLKTLHRSGLDKASYYTLIADLRMAPSPREPFWKLERYWTIMSAGGSRGPC